MELQRCSKTLLRRRGGVNFDGGVRWHVVPLFLLLTVDRQGCFFNGWSWENGKGCFDGSNLGKE
ncbi:uncharacterized protein G2W53_021640 [Senna tora]|uniref:Uncharacterized protein n=1 Tax=Senna tora TaxID=362788 RepID=A0A834TMB9_9FABA|nr:uncharacterized protein G2W53_021640 [Senna tora]